MTETPSADEIVAYETLQWAFGGLVDGRPLHEVCLVGATHHGTPGPTLCGKDRFAKGGPGWSLGGGCTDPDALCCPGCLAACLADQKPVEGIFHALYAAAGAPTHHSHSADNPARNRRFSGRAVTNPTNPGAVAEITMLQRQVHDLVAQRDELIRLAARRRSLLEAWEPRVTCPQCGERYSATACGPTHALVHDAVTSRPDELIAAMGKGGREARERPNG